jgi:hypothetical protein
MKGNVGIFWGKRLFILFSGLSTLEPETSCFQPNSILFKAIQAYSRPPGGGGGFILFAAIIFV